MVHHLSGLAFSDAPHAFDLPRSRDVMGHVTVGLPIVHFL